MVENIQISIECNDKYNKNERILIKIKHMTMRLNLRQEDMLKISHA